MNIVILGGGTAGWITALYAQRTMPEESITVIESSELGILGAGEITRRLFTKSYWN
jgi:glycine/D-amino acid oxidase-like deaminating enzyme